MTIGFVIGAAIAAPVFFGIGLFAGIDRSVRREPTYVRPSLRRSL